MSDQTCPDVLACVCVCLLRVELIKSKWLRLLHDSSIEYTAPPAPSHTDPLTNNRSKDKSGPNAKDLLKKYGSAYLVTSITLALISFSICYVRRVLDFMMHAHTPKLSFNVQVDI